MSEDTSLNAVELATELTIAWLGNQNNRISADDVPAFLRTMHATVTELAGGTSTPAVTEDETMEAPTFTPAVTVRKSLASKDHIISLIDGKPYKTLRRHLTGHGLTAEEYRARYNLKSDYPMVSETYSATRRALAHKIGLGSKGRTAKAAVAKSFTPPKTVRAKSAPVADVTPAPKPKRAPRRLAEAV